MDTHLMLKKHHDQRIKESRAAERGLRTCRKPYSILPERKRTVQAGSVQEVAHLGSEHWWDPKEVGRRDDLHCLFN
jgi:hypothetical protein